MDVGEIPLRIRTESELVERRICSIGWYSGRGGPDGTVDDLRERPSLNFARPTGSSPRMSRSRKIRPTDGHIAARTRASGNRGVQCADGYEQGGCECIQMPSTRQ